MNPVLFEIVVNQALVLDLFGVIGLGLVAFGAIRLAARFGSINARMMTWGALALILGRVGILAYGAIVTPANFMEFDPTVLSVGKNVPIGLMTLGLGMLVVGFWSHERDLSDAAPDGV
jgi:hypothetical protein